MEDQREFYDQLLREFPELRDLYVEHVEFNDSLLAHPFMADIVRWLLEQYSSSAKGRSSFRVGERLIDFMGGWYKSGDSGVRNLIAVSFVENLPTPGYEFSEIVEHLDAGLLEVYVDIFGNFDRR